MADTLLGGIVINEILVDPNGANNFDTDGNGTASAVDEYVELYNTSAGPIDISGVQLWDQGVGNWFTFPPGTILAAGGHAMVMSGVQAGGSLPTGAPGDLFFEAGRGSALINNGGDNVVVYDPAADQYISATFNGDTLDDPTATYSGFSATATQSGAGENFGNDTDGFSLQRNGDGGNTFVGNQTPTPGTTNICFTQGTLFQTDKGLRRIEELRPGDLLMTLDNGLQPIRWIWARKRDLASLLHEPALHAVLIRKGALGNGLPLRDLRVSRQHRILVQSKIAWRMFDKLEVLTPAKDLLGLKGVTLEVPTQDITYFHILLEDHQVLLAEGTPAESLYLGAEARHALEPAALQELALIFGKDWQAFCQDIPPARPLVSGRRARLMAARHAKNNKALQSVPALS